MISIYDNYLEDNKDLIDVISNISEGKKPKLGPDEVLVVKGKQEKVIDIDDLREYLKKDWELNEATLTKNQQDMVKDVVDNDLDLEEFEKKYGKKDGKSVAFAVATNMVKKKEGITEDDLDEGKIQTKIAKTKKGKITVTDHDSLEDAKKHLEDMKKKGWNGIISQDGKPITEEELNEVDYMYDGKVVKISKKNFSKVHKDFKNSTKGKERMLINDPKTGGSISVPVQFEEVELDEKKSATDYEVYHKSFSAAMQHAYEYAEKKGHSVDKDEIDDKVALGPKKPSKGKTNRYDLKAGRKTAHIQVYNMNDKSYELNMYIEEVQLDEGFSEKEIKMAIGIASDKRYAGGNMTGATKAIEKIKKGLSEHPQVKAALKRQNEVKDTESTPHLLGDSHWEASDELVKYLRTLTPGENPETELDEDAKMAKKSDDDLMSMLHQMLGADQSLPSIKFQTKRIRKELKKRGLKEDSTELDEAQGKNIDHLRDIISGKTANTLKFSDGTMKVDLFSASGIVQVYDKVNKMNQDKLDKMVNGSKKDFIKAQEIAFKLINKSKK